jgi:hypothetical protein
MARAAALVLSALCAAAALRGAAAQYSWTSEPGGGRRGGRAEGGAGQGALACQGQTRRSAGAPARRHAPQPGLAQPSSPPPAPCTPPPPLPRPTSRADLQTCKQVQDAAEQVLAQMTDAFNNRRGWNRKYTITLACGGTFNDCAPKNRRAGGGLQAR